MTDRQARRAKAESRSAALHSPASRQFPAVPGWSARSAVAPASATDRAPFAAGPALGAGQRSSKVLLGGEDVQCGGLEIRRIAPGEYLTICQHRRHRGVRGDHAAVWFPIAGVRLAVRVGQVGADGETARVRCFLMATHGPANQRGPPECVSIGCGLLYDIVAAELLGAAMPPDEATWSGRRAAAQVQTARWCGFSRA